MRYIGLSAREAYNVLKDYSSSCDSAASVLALAMDQGEYRSALLEVTFSPGPRFDIRTFSSKPPPPRANPLDPKIRLLRAVYGQCPDCDNPEPHTHAEGG